MASNLFKDLVMLPFTVDLATLRSSGTEDFNTSEYDILNAYFLNVFSWCHNIDLHREGDFRGIFTSQRNSLPSSELQQTFGHRLF